VGDGTGRGTVNGDIFLPSLHLLSGSEYLSSTTAWSLFSCSGLSGPRHIVIATYGWGIWLKRWKKDVSYIGGHGASGAVSDMYYISVVSVESVNQKADIQYQLYPMLRASMCMRASIRASMSASGR